MIPIKTFILIWLHILFCLKNILHAVMCLHQIIVSVFQSSDQDEAWLWWKVLVVN